MKEVFVFAVRKQACLCFLNNTGVAENAKKIYEELGNNDASFIDTGHNVSTELQSFIKETLQRQYLESTIANLIEDLKLTVDFWRMKNGEVSVHRKSKESIGVWDLRGHPNDSKMTIPSVLEVIGCGSGGLKIDTPVEGHCLSIASTHVPISFERNEHEYTSLKTVLDIYAPNMSIFYCKSAKRTFTTTESVKAVHELCEGIDDFHLISTFYLDDEHLDSFISVFHCKSCNNFDTANKKFEAFKTLYGISKDDDINDDYHEVSKIADVRFKKGGNENIMLAKHVNESITEALCLSAERQAEVAKMMPNYLRDYGFNQVTVDDKEHYKGIRYVDDEDFCVDTESEYSKIVEERKI